MLTDPERVLLQIAEILDRLGIAYAVGGSVASSRYGEVRATNDVDLLVDLSPDEAAAWAAAMRAQWYVDADAAREAARAHRSFNAIHLGVLLKIDFFVLGDDPLDRRQMERRRAIELGDPPGRSVWFTAPEDVVLRKLSWFRASGGALERQWRDAVGVLKTQRSTLDVAALRAFAGRAGLTDLLERALRDAGIA